MPFFSDMRETSALYGTYIAEFQKLCRRHEVSLGTPEDLFRLPTKLAYDEGFRADFYQLTKSVAQREEGRLTLTRILTIIALALGGESIDTIGTSGAVPLSLVVVFLAGIGGWNENEKDDGRTSAAPFAEQAPQARTAMAAEKAGIWEEEEKEAVELERRLTAGPNDLGTMTASLFGGPALVKEALSRLELNTLELKLHLDSIDSRMERIEPHLDDLTSRLAKETPPTEATDSQRSRGPLPAIRYSQPELRLAQGASETGGTSVAPAPPRDTSELRRLHRLVTALGMLLVVMAAVLGTLLYISHGRLMKAEIDRILAWAVGDASAKTNSPSSPANDAGGRSAADSRKATASRQGGLDPPAKSKPPSPKLEPSETVIRSGLGSAPRKITIERTKEEEPPKAPAIHLADALPGAVAARLPIGPGVRPDEASAPIAATASASAAAGDKTAMDAAEGRIKIFVPASTMLPTAIASPPPAYPPMARIRRVEGDVLLQALVDENGTVEAVSVVNGPEALRNAAIDALRSWRFKPYLLDGHPVAVRTIVNFHFKMAQ